MGSDEGGHFAGPSKAMNRCQNIDDDDDDDDEVDEFEMKSRDAINCKATCGGPTRPRALSFIRHCESRAHSSDRSDCSHVACSFLLHGFAAGRPSQFIHCAGPEVTSCENNTKRCKAARSRNEVRMKSKRNQFGKAFRARNSIRANRFQTNIQFARISDSKRRCNAAPQPNALRGVGCVITQSSNSIGPPAAVNYHFISILIYDDDDDEEHGDGEMQHIAEMNRPHVRIPFCCVSIGAECLQ